MKTLFDARYRTHRETLKQTIGQTDKMPANFSGRFEDVVVPSSTVVQPLQKDDRGHYRRVAVPGTWTVVVKSSAEVATGGRNYAKHRVFIVGKCGKEIPAGRLAQHVPHCDKCKG